MTFIHRLGISVALAAAFPLFAINYSLPSAYEAHLMFTCTIAWLFMLPLSMYSSPTAPVQYDGQETPAPIFKKEAYYARWLAVASYLFHVLSLL